MKGNVIKVCAIALCLMLCMGAVACADTDTAPSGEASLPDDDFKSAVDTGSESELYKRYEEYREKASLAFLDTDPTKPSDFTYTLDGGEVEIVKYVGSDTVVRVPAEIDGAVVTRIGEGAFEGSKIRAVYVPDTVDGIAQGAFVECDNLATLVLPMIGDGADNAFLGYIFGGASHDENAVKVPPSLDMLIIGEGVERIEKNALRGCKTLSALVLPESVKEIGELAMYGCSDLIYVSLGGAYHIGEYAFANCSSLYSIDCSNVEKIENGAFYSCQSLNTIEYVLHEGDFLGRIFGAETYQHNEDFVPRSLRTVKVAQGSVEIPSMAFACCKYICAITLPESLEKIGVRAFYLCRSLYKISVPDNVTAVGDDAFFGCDALTDAVLGDSVESLGMQAFFGCSSLESISLPDTLTEIKPYTFYGCNALARIDLGGVTKIGEGNSVLMRRGG